DLWTRYHFTERHDSPLTGIAKEYSVFMAVMDQYASQRHVSPAQMEAIADEFYSLLAFSEKIAGTLKASKLQISFAGASIAGVSLTPEFMKDDYQTVFEILEKGL